MGCLQNVISQASTGPQHPKQTTLEPVLKDPAASIHQHLSDSSCLSSFRNRQLLQVSPAEREAVSGAGQNSKGPAGARGTELYGFAGNEGSKPIQHPGSIVVSGPGWRLGFNGSPGQPQGKNGSPAPLRTLGAINGISSSGSQGSAQLRQSGPTCDSKAGIITRQRSSKKLASKHAQHDVQDSPPASPAQRKPEAALPHSISGQLEPALEAKQPSHEDNLVLPGLSSCKEPASCDTQSAAVLTLDQALDAMTPPQSFSLGLHNPFEAVARGDCTWQVTSRLGGSEGRDGRASSCSTITCDEDQLPFSLPEQVCHLSLIVC